LVWRRWREGSS